MRHTALVLAALLPALPLLGEEAAPRKALTYSAASIVNAASYDSGALAPGGLATIFGKEMAWGTHALVASDLRGNTLPVALPGTGARVIVSGLQAHLLYVSPEQINFLVPSILIPGPVTVQVVRDGLAGPEVALRLEESAPGLFFESPGIALAAHHPGGKVVRTDNPARPGEWVILYATGLGSTTPPQFYGELAQFADPVPIQSAPRVWLDGVALPSQLVYYVGVTPGYAGLYQVNLHMPDSFNADPEIRLECSGRLSPAGVRLPARPD